MPDVELLIAPVAALMREVAAEIVMPRFQTLAAHEVMEKAPGDLVTIADREAEERLTVGLASLLPEARTIGEEAVAADPALLDGIADGLVWIVDPIDGTHNFAEGKRPFAIMIALARDGETLAGWILDAVTGRLIHAVRGGGAFIDGRPIVSTGTGAPLPVMVLSVHYLPAEMRPGLEARMSGKLAGVAAPRCAGEQYPRLALGENDACLFWKSYPWDHAPGALILAEAGGKLARFDGSPYRLGDLSFGLIGAATPDLWERARAVLLD